MRRKFLRQNWFRHKKLGIKWRKPRGRHSKMREMRKGKPPRVKIGYKNPQAAVAVPVVHNPAELIGLSKETAAGIIVSSATGARKTEAIVKEAEKLGIKILNREKMAKARQISREIGKKRAERAEKAKKGKAVKEDEQKKTAEIENKKESEAEKKVAFNVNEGV